MNEARFLRVPTIFEALERAGVRTLCVTAKDKLRAIRLARWPTSSRAASPRPRPRSASAIRTTTRPRWGP